MKHERLNHPSQIDLREKHSELLLDIEAVAKRANAARHKADRERADAIVEAAEAALVRVHDAWRKSRGGAQNNVFFTPLSSRLRRIIRFYKTDAKPTEGEPGWIYRIVDYEQIPFHRLKPWFRASAVDDAIRMGISLGLRELPGVRIWKLEE